LNVVTSGRLFLLYNDDSGLYGNNTGSYQVTVTTSTSSALTVTAVYTRDGNGNVQNTFAPGATIQYVVNVNNSSGNSMNITLHYQAYGPNNNFIFDSTFTATIPQGASGWYVQGTVPNNAPAGTYTMRVHVQDQNNTQNQDTKEGGQFTVKTSTSSALTVQKVWTADSYNNAWTAFAPGDPIHYRVQVKNTKSTTVTATFTFGATGPQKIFSWSGSKSVASGTHTITSASNVPTTAPAGSYTLTVTVTYNGVSSSGKSQFTVATRIYGVGNYGGKFVILSNIDTSGRYNEPPDLAHVNYCGPAASQELISAWTSNVPGLETLATEEKTNQGKTGTYMSDMVVPINNAIGRNYYSVHHASSQGDFSNMIGGDILNNHHPLITGINTKGNGYTLKGWDHSANHIITIYGFDFRSPSVGYIYYYETASKLAGETEGPGPKSQDYKEFYSLVTLLPVQLSAT